MLRRHNYVSNPKQCLQPGRQVKIQPPMCHEGMGTTRMWPVGVKRPPLSNRKTNPGYPFTTKPVVPPSHSGSYGDRKTFLPLPGNEP